MARKKKTEESGVAELVEGTVEYERQQHFDREKAAYEERTGEKVAYELDAPLTSTPLPSETVREIEDETVDETGGEG